MAMAYYSYGHIAARAYGGILDVRVTARASF